MWHNREAGVESKWSRAERLAQVAGESLQLKVLSECILREMSPQTFHREVGTAKLARVVQAFELLVQYDWIEPTRVDDSDPEEVETFYRAIDSLIVEDDVWRELPDSTKALVTARIVESFSGRVKEAMKAGTIWARDDAHIIWTPLELDQQGWDALFEQIEEVFDSLVEQQRRACVRMAESGEEPIPTTVALFTFESPPDVSPKRGPGSGRGG
jgi:hypothetical protein